MNDPREALQKARELSQKDFRAVTQTILKTATQDADALAEAIGDISFDEAYQAWVRKLKYLLEPMKGH